MPLCAAAIGLLATTTNNNSSSLQVMGAHKYVWPFNNIHNISFSSELLWPLTLVDEQCVTMATNGLISVTQTLVWWMCLYGNCPQARRYTGGFWGHGEHGWERQPMDTRGGGSWGRLWVLLLSYFSAGLTQCRMGTMYWHNIQYSSADQFSVTFGS